MSHLHKNEKCSPSYNCVGAMIMLMQEEEAERRKKQVSISFHQQLHILCFIFFILGSNVQDIVIVSINDLKVY